MSVNDSSHLSLSGMGLQPVQPVQNAPRTVTTGDRGTSDPQNPERKKPVKIMNEYVNGCL